MSTEARQALVVAEPEAEYNLRLFDDYIRKPENGPAGFMVLKVGGGILDRPKLLEACVGSIAYLGKLGFTPLVIHGGGPQINQRLNQAGIAFGFRDGLRVTSKDAMKEIVNVLDDVNVHLVDRLEEHGQYAKGFPRAFVADYIDRQKYGEVGSVTGFVDAQNILFALEDGRIPVISCLGRLASGEGFLNINADDAAAEVARALHPLKYVALSPPGGVLDSNGEIISVITPELAKDLAARNVLSKGMLKKVREGLNLVEGGVASDVVLVHPSRLIQELFTHEGYGTLITKDVPLRIYGKSAIDGLDKKRITRLIETAFDGRLDSQYFQDTEIAKIIITTQSYDGVGIFLDTNDPELNNHDILYMDKLAVMPHARGRGIAQQIIEAAGPDGLFWRASADNPYLGKYAAIADGSQIVHPAESHKAWTVYWRNVPPEIIPSLLRYAQQRPVTIHRAHGLSNS